MYLQLQTKVASPNKFINMSAAYAENGSQLKDVMYFLTARVANAETMNEFSFMDTIDNIGYEAGLEKHQISPNRSFIGSLSIDMNKLLMYTGLSLFIFIVSAIVIYSIFYISVINRTRELGQLRTIGATNVQIRKIIKKEGVILSYCSIPVGLLIGILILFISKPDGFELISTITISAFVFIAMFITVMVSISKPSKLAGKVSPLEASKQTLEKTWKKQTKQLERKLSPLNLAIMSRKTNRKKFIMTTLSLGLTGIVFMIGAIFISSYSIEANARQGAFEFNEISMSLSSNAIDLHEHGEIGLQLESPFSPELLAKIGQIDGVNTILKAADIPVSYEYKESRREDRLAYINADDLELYKEYQTDLNANYNDMVANNGVIISANDVYNEIYGDNFSVGDTILLSWFDGNDRKEETFTVMGVLDVDNTAFMYTDKDAYHTQMTHGWFIIAEDKFTDMMIPEFDPTSRLLISTDWNNKGEEVIQQIEEILEEHPNVLIDETFSDAMIGATSLYDELKVMLVSIMLFLGSFTIINLFNTLITNVLSRKQEFAIMQSIGLTDKQLKKVIGYEGLLFAFYNSLITLLIGGSFGYLMVLAFEGMAINYLVWSFPTQYLLAYVFVVTVVPFIISLGLVKVLQSQSVVERLRDN